MSTADRRVAIVAGARFTTGEPHAGGLERHTDVLARELAALGDDVTVFAGVASQLDATCLPYRVEPLVPEAIVLSDHARRDVSMPPEQFIIEHDAYLYADQRIRDMGFDVVHNNSLHYLPVLSDAPQPRVHTLHTPPTPWLESAYRARAAWGDRSRHHPASTVISVSATNALAWPNVVDRVISNGIDLAQWPRGDGGGGYVVWSGRIVAEKGPELAIAAAKRCGRRLVLAGPRHDPEFFDAHVAPHLGTDCEWAGHLGSEELAALLGGADAALVTPRWDEPFGLVVAEALACGTPVAGFSRGALPDLIDDQVGALAPADDVAALAEAIERAITRSRTTCRQRALTSFSATVMARHYSETYDVLLGRDPRWNTLSAVLGPDSALKYHIEPRHNETLEGRFDPPVAASRSARR